MTGKPLTNKVAGNGNFHLYRIAVAVVAETVLVGSGTYVVSAGNKVAIKQGPEAAIVKMEE